MRNLKVTKDFTYFHRGTVRKDYAKGDEVETEDNEMADVAVAEGWAKELPAKQPPKDAEASDAAPAQ